MRIVAETAQITTDQRQNRTHPGRTSFRPAPLPSQEEAITDSDGHRPAPHTPEPSARTGASFTAALLAGSLPRESPIELLLRIGSTRAPHHTEMYLRDRQA